MLNYDNDNEHFFPVPDFNENSILFSLFIVMFAIDIC